jgi:hypothetical protein
MQRPAKRPDTEKKDEVKEMVGDGGRAYRAVFFKLGSHEINSASQKQQL